MSDATPALWAIRLGLVIAGLAGWFWTQRLIGRQAWPAGNIGDGVHQLTAPLNRYLHVHPRAADALLVTTSAIIDALGLFILARSIFGPTVRPFLGLLILYALRQICQGLCALPPPEGMIWRRPGIPSLLVTYGTATDLFFSGHTAIAVFGCIELARRPWRPRRPRPRVHRIVLLVGTALPLLLPVLLSPYPYTVYSVPPAPVIVEQPVYTQQPAAAPEGYWYYCESSKAYYPSVPMCAEAWIKVPPRSE